jgi:hypothetical protein
VGGIHFLPFFYKKIIMENFQGVNDHGDLHIGTHILHLHNLKNWSKEDFKKEFAGKLHVDIDLVWAKVESGLQEIEKEKQRKPVEAKPKHEYVIVSPPIEATVKEEKAPKKTKVVKVSKTK